MADNLVLDPGAGGGTVRTLEDASTVHWAAGVCAYATTVGTPDVLQIVTPTAGLPVQPQTGATWAVTATSLPLPAGAATAANQAVAISYLDVFATDGMAVAGSVSHGLADVGTGPIKIGGRAAASEPAAVDDGDRVNAYFDLNGRQHVIADGTTVVSAASLPLPTGAATAANQATAIASLATLAGAVAGTEFQVDVLTLPNVTIANATLAVTQSGAWSVTANAGTNLNTSALALEAGGNLAAIAASLAILDNVVAGSEAQVDVLSLPNVTLAASTNTNEVVGDAAHDAVVAGNPLLVGLDARHARATAVSADGDAVRAVGDRYGRTQCVGVEVAPAVVQATASGNTVLVAAPAAGNKLRVKRVELSNSHATTGLTVGVRFGAAGTIFSKAYLPALGGAKVVNLSGDFSLGGDAEALNVNLSAAGQVECTAFYETVVA